MFNRPSGYINLMAYHIQEIDYKQHFLQLIHEVLVKSKCFSSLTLNCGKKESVWKQIRLRLWQTAKSKFFITSTDGNSTQHAAVSSEHPDTLLPTAYKLSDNKREDTTYTCVITELEGYNLTIS